MLGIAEGWDGHPKGQYERALQEVAARGRSMGAHRLCVSPDGAR
ncbi:hypothetical protein PCAR4_800027 [Paraburkholderia caribensis]|nr:hypothetical protein PCAR4_800027 [Paraburkholderia caribensis]